MDGDEPEDEPDDGTTAEPRADERPVARKPFARDLKYSPPRLSDGTRRRGFHQDAPDDED